MLNVKVLNPFLDAANEVLAAEARVKVNRGALSLQKSAMTTDDVTVLLNMVGQVQGVVLYSLSSRTGQALATAMMGQEFGSFDSLAQSGIAELGNVITGRASVKLADAGFEVDISPPTLIMGKAVTISTLDFSRLVVPLTTDLGEITVHLALREHANEAAEPLVRLALKAVP
jgi:chemotaxis protein CheX